MEQKALEFLRALQSSDPRDLISLEEEHKAKARIGRDGLLYIKVGSYKYNAILLSNQL